MRDGHDARRARELLGAMQESPQLQREGLERLSGEPPRPTGAWTGHALFSFADERASAASAGARPYAPMLPGSTLKPGPIVDDRLIRFT